MAVNEEMTVEDKIKMSLHDSGKLFQLINRSRASVLDSMFGAKDAKTMLGNTMSLID